MTSDHSEQFYWGTLAAIDRRLDRIDRRLEVLNAWHNKVNGALWALGAVGSVGVAVGLAVLGKLP